MSSPRPVTETFLNLMRDAFQQPALSLDEALEKPLAKLLLSTLDKQSEGSPPPGVQAIGTQPPAPSLSVFHNSTAFLLAAIHDTFALSELEPTPEQRAALLTASDLVMIQGKRRLRLCDASRAEILAAARRGNVYEKLLRDWVERDAQEHAAIGEDPIRLPSAWLRCFLSAEFEDLDSAPPREIKAALAARQRLQYVQDLPKNVPTLDELGRRVGLAELLEPLRLLIGAQGGWDGTPRRDRFVGRANELMQLRAFVDELSSESSWELLGRLSAKVKRAFTGSERPGLMIVEARGGLGKSTLLAKFVLDHALLQSRPFPFAYLDFDRAGIDPERPHQLLIEIARQLGLQFPTAQRQVDGLIADLRGELAQSPASRREPAAIQDFFSRFVEIVREHATFGVRAFLLVLDTLEVVQWNSAAMHKLSGMIAEFRAKGLSELRVVASGRADVPELRHVWGAAPTVIELSLKPLLVKEARLMADALGNDLIGFGWDPTWSVAIAGRSTQDEARREPLAVRVAVDLIARASPAERDDLASEIGRAGFEADDDFVARLYEKRIVSHVRDPLAKRLAWPGLIVRRVTPEIVHELLAEFCHIDPQDAQRAFEALGREVWMVTPDDGALKHRPDLRARTLPLMRNKEPKRFEAIARAAVDYFAGHRKRSDEDYAEWIYHRLLSGQSPQEVEADLRRQPNVLSLLVRAEVDFPADSPAASFIAARTSHVRLSPRRIRALQPHDALRHLSLTSPGSFGLDDAALDAATLDVASRIDAADFSEGGELAPWARALWIKTGAWFQVRESVAFADKLPQLALRSHLFWATRLAPRLGRADQRELFEGCSRAFSGYSIHHERIGFRTTVQMMALARIVQSPEFLALDKEVAGLLSSRKPNPLPSIQAALRTAIVLGKSCRGPAVELWLASRRRGGSERVLDPAVSLRELQALLRVNPQAKDLRDKIETEGDIFARYTDESIVASAHQLVDEMAGESELEFELSRVFASRNEDWIVPFGYAAARAYPGRIPAVVSQRIAGYAPQGDAKEPVQKAQIASDLVAAMRLADEASDLTGLAQLVLAHCDERLSATDELRYLLACRDAWSKAVAAMIGDTFVPTAGKQKVAAEEHPPDPGPVIDVRNPQKGRWGGLEQRQGRAIRATLDSVERDVFYFSVVVESTDGSTLAAPVIFHLHDSYPRSVVAIRRIANGKQAKLSGWNAYGVFAIGVQVRDSAGKWLSLELDLSNLAGLPKRFRNR